MEYGDWVRGWGALCGPRGRLWIRELGKDSWRGQLRVGWGGSGTGTGGMSGSLDTGILRWGVTMFGYLSPSVLCLFFLDGHRIHVVGSNKQGLVSEFRADLCQEFLRARNLLERESWGGGGGSTSSPHGKCKGLEVSRLGSLGSGLRPESEGWWSQCPQPEHAPAHFTRPPRSPLQLLLDCSGEVAGVVGLDGQLPFFSHSWQEWMTFP